MRIKLLILHFICSFIPFTNGQLPVVNGWTVFTPSSDSRIIYVSSANGNDATAHYHLASTVGTDPFNPSLTIQPYQTIEAAKTQLRNGYPDWLLLENGTVFTNQSFGLMSISGRSENEPMLFGTYGTSPLQAEVLTGNNHLFNFNGHASFIAITGIKARPHTRTPVDQPSAINILNAPFESFLVENCHFDGFSMTIVVQDYSGSAVYTHAGFTARRNTIINGHNSATSGGGVYMHRVTNILFEGNFIDNNGWQEGTVVPSAFSHNTYFQSTCANLIFRDNIISRASAVGIGARCGGIIENNFVVGNPRGILVGSFDESQINWPTEGVAATVKNNVVLDARVESFDAGNGITMERVRNVNLEKNIIAHLQNSSTYPIGFAADRFDNLSLNRNIVYNWANNQTSGPNFGSGLQIGPNRLGSNTFDSTEIQFTNNQSHCVSVYGGFNLLAFNDNNYHNVVAPNNWFSEGTFAQWTANSMETNGSVQQISYLDPTRNITSYLTHISSPGTDLDFYQRRMQMSKANWDVAYEANSINQYIREGFNLTTEPVNSTSNLKSTSDYLIYPNPSSSQITIESLHTTAYQLLSIQGACLQMGQLQKGANKLNLEPLTPGIYFLEVGGQSIRIHKN